MTADESNRERAQLQREGIPVRGGDHRIRAKPRLKAAVSAAAVCTTVNRSQPPPVTTVIDRRTFREKASDGPWVDRQRGGTRLRTASPMTVAAGNTGEP